jgi:hypothetical protein
MQKALSPFLLILLTCSFSVSFGQTKEMDSLDNTRFHFLFIEPLAVLQPYANTARFGIEVPLVKNFSLNASYGINLTQGFSVKAEIKKYFITGKDMDISYVSAEYLYKTETYDATDNIRYNDGGIIKPSDTVVTYRVSKNVGGVRLKFGGITRWGKRFLIDYYGGIGIRHKQVDAAIDPKEQDRLYHYHESDINHESNTEFHGYRLDFTIGVKLGWLFKKM